MSNYKFGLAVANSFQLSDGTTGKVISPQDPAWWAGFIPYVLKRYDTPKIERGAAEKKLLPMFLYWEGEHIFHYSHTERVQKRDRFFRRVLPPEHPIHQFRSAEELAQLKAEKSDLQKRVMRLMLVDEKSEEQVQEEKLLEKKLQEYHDIDFYPPDPFMAYGGDYWLHELYKNVAFWEGLHRAGTRGLFVLEVGSEQSLRFDGFEYALYGQASCPAWFLIVADLRGDDWTLERVYPRVSDFQAVKEGEEYGQDLHFYAKYEGQMITEALSNPHRETLTAEILHIPDEPWYVY